MTSQVDRNDDQYQNSDMRPTNSHVNGPGALGSDPSHDSNQRRFDKSNANTQGGDYSTQQHPQQHQPPPTHPERANQEVSYGQGQGPSGPNTSVGQGQYDSSTTQGQDEYGSQPHTLDRRGHRGPEAQARAAEAGVVNEGEKVAHGGQHTGSHGGQYQNDTATGTHGGQHTGSQEGQYQSSTAMGPTQNETYGNQGPGATGATGHHQGGVPIRAAEAGATYEGGKLASKAGGNTLGHGHGTGPATGPTGTAPNAGQTTGPTGFNTAAGTTTGASGAPGTTHPGANEGFGQESAAYNQQPVGATTAGPTAGTTTTGAAGPGATTGTRTTGSASQPNVILGKLQQAGGMLLGNESMKEKGLQRESKGVAKSDQGEAERLEGLAYAKRQKAGGIHPGTGPANANAGVDPTVGTQGRKF